MPVVSTPVVVTVSPYVRGEEEHAGAERSPQDVDHGIGIVLPLGRKLLDQVVEFHW